VQETGTIWVQDLADLAAGHFLYVARITDVEMTAAIARRRRLGSLSPAQSGHALNAFRQDFAQRYRIVEITIPLIQEASRLADSHVLRAYDAVQLAPALDIHRLDPSLTLLSADAELNTTAIAEGLTVDDPTAILARIRCPTRTQMTKNRSSVYDPCLTSRPSSPSLILTHLRTGIQSIRRESVLRPHIRP
jgi:uncharacterized protein